MIESSPNKLKKIPLFTLAEGNREFSNISVDDLEHFWTYDKKRVLKNISENRALDLFHKASKHIPAYKHFLKSKNIKPRSVKSLNDFKKIPVTNKSNYINKYPLNALCWDGKLDSYNIIATSTGTSGKTNIWPRDAIAEYESKLMHELLFDSVFKSKSKKTLFLVCFAMGSYTAGFLTGTSAISYSESGRKFVVVTPGNNKEETIKIIKKVAKNFSQVIIAGYPTWLQDLFESLKASDFGSAKVKLMPAGEVITDSWKKSFKFVNEIYGLYGCSEKQLLAYESPKSLKINKKIQKLSVEISDLSVYQYLPFFRYFEELNTRLIVSGSGGIPLIRYDTKDKGMILNPETKTHEEYFRKINTCLPFVIVFGREDSLTFKGANVSISEVKESIKGMSDLTGLFIMESNPEFHLHFEMKQGLELSIVSKKNLQEKIISRLSENNSEFSDALQKNERKYHPKFSFLSYKSSPHFLRKGKHKFIVR